MSHQKCAEASATARPCDAPRSCVLDRMGCRSQKRRQAQVSSTAFTPGFEHPSQVGARPRLRPVVSLAGILRPTRHLSSIKWNWRPNTEFSCHSAGTAELSPNVSRSHDAPTQRHYESMKALSHLPGQQSPRSAARHQHSVGEALRAAPIGSSPRHSRTYPDVYRCSASPVVVWRLHTLPLLQTRP